MSYHVLARKWRPQTFADLVGQSHVVKALTYALSNQKIHHAYLLTGTRGVGKTSIARIFAKSLNCEQNGVSAEPCGVCESCVEIKAGKFVDLIEVDAASRTGVDETRELIDSVAYLPTKGRYKVYLIDEVHMFSKSSFNALLKTLEEPPEHVKFILATTDPEKLPITILSRCLQFNLKSLTPPQIRQHLVNICEAESIPYDKEALSLLANAGDGSMRDTLSMTDQAIAYGHGELRMAAVTEILGTIQPNDIEAILFAVATNNPNQLSQALHRLDDYEVDARAFLIDIMRRLQQMAWAKEGIAEDLSPTLQSTVNDIPKPLLHLWYDIAEKALSSLSVVGEPRQAVEMALLRMLAFIPEDWVTRHRTPLESVQSETIQNAPVSTSPSATPSNTTPDSVATTNEVPPPAEASSSPDDFAAQVQAMPVTEHDSLDAAEAEFSGDNHAQPAESVAENIAAEDIAESIVENASAEMPTETPTEATQTTPAAPSGETEAMPPPTDVLFDAADVADTWQLSSESHGNEQAPSMDDVRAMMQSGRDIAPPPKRETTDEPTNEPMNEPMNEPAIEAQPTVIVENVSERVPPWQDESPVEVVQETAVQTDNGEEAQPTSAHALSPTEADTTKTSTEESPIAEKSPATEPSPQPQAVATADIDHFDWYDTLSGLGLSEYTHHLASLSILRLEQADGYLQATLDLAPKHELLITEASLQELNQALENHFNIPINLQTHLTEITEQTPQERDKISSDKQQADLISAFRKDPISAKLLAAFDGQVIEKTIKAKESAKLTKSTVNQ